TGCPGRFESELVTQPIEELVGHSFPHAHGAITLHVAVSTYGRGSRSRSTNVAAQEQKVHYLADGGDRVSMLGDPHGPTDDDALGRHHLRREVLYLRARKAALEFDP